MLIGLLPLTAQWWQIEEAEEVNGKHKSAIQFNSKSKKAEILKGSQKHNHPEGEDEDRTTKISKEWDSITFASKRATETDRENLPWKQK